MRNALLLGLSLPFLAMTTTTLHAKQTIHFKEYLGHTWADELISYPLDASLRSKALQVIDESGAQVPFQVSGDRIWFLVTLAADTERTFTVAEGNSTSKSDRQAPVIEEGEFVTLDSGAAAVRLPGGAKKFEQPVEPSTVPGPMQGVRGATGNWIGKSWLEAPLKVTGHTTTVTARGPLFAEATVEYAFEGGKHYRFTVRAIAGQPTLIVDEAMDLNPGGKYKIPHYDNDSEASTWEWWDFDTTTHPANVVISFYDGLKPNQCRWTGHHANHPRKGVNAEGKTWTSAETNDTEAYAPLVYEEDEQFNRIACWWTNSFGDRSNYFSFYNDADPGSPVISLSRGRPGCWVNADWVTQQNPMFKLTTAMNDLRILTKKSKDLQVVGPICLGSRQWLLSVEPQSALPPKGGKQSPYAYSALIKYGYFPLDKIKDWTFDWPEPKNAWPRLFCKAGDLAAMKARVAAAPGAMGQSALIPAIYRTNGTTEAMVKQATDSLKGAVDGALSGTAHGGFNWFHASLHMMQAMPIFEAAMATPGMDPAVRAKLKAYGAFVAQRAWDNDYWPPKENGNGWGSANMGILAAGARVLSAGAMAGHPQQKAWLARSRGYLLGNLQGLLAPDGSGLSCPHYLGASADPVLYMALALKFGGDYDAFKEDARMAKFGQFMMDMLTPPDPRSPLNGPTTGLPMGAKIDPTAKNRRNMWPLGHTSRTETSGILDMLALGYAGVNEKLAGSLRWMSAEMGATSQGAFVAYALLCNTTSTPVPPDLRSRCYHGYGVFLRDKQDSETWFAARYSKFAFDHFQSDTGAFTMFAKGVPLMMDFGSMYSPENGQAIYHNRVAWDVREGEQKPCPGNGSDGCYYKGLTFFAHKFEPWTDKSEFYVEGMAITDAGGETKAFSSLPDADYVEGVVDVKGLKTEPYFPDTPQALALDPTQKIVHSKVPPFSWVRRVLFAKASAKGEASYFLVRDDFTAPCPPPTLSFWVMANDLKFDGNHAHATGQFGVDLELYAAQPAKPQFSQWQWEHRNWGGEKQLCIRITQPEGKPFVTLLYPRRLEEPVPTFTTIADGNGVKLQVATTTDYAFLSPTPLRFAEGKLSFEGTSGYALVTTDSTTASLTAAGKTSVRGVTMETERGANLQVNSERLTLHTNGDAQTLSLSGQLPKKLNLIVDGKKSKATMKKGILQLHVAAGEHEITIE